jgi:hypothetical protein
MLKPMHKHALWGFLFGSLGLFVLAMVSMLAAPLETLFAPLFWFGRQLSVAFVGPVGSDLDTALVALANGVFYAAIFVGIGQIRRVLRRQKK